VAWLRSKVEHDLRPATASPRPDYALLMVLQCCAEPAVRALMAQYAAFADVYPAP
jgi:hypothetical protein